MATAEQFIGDPNQKYPGRPQERLLFVDGLRGIAALAVVFYHFRGAIDEISTGWMVPFIDTLFVYGYLGVDIFFVISGFVIPFSVRHATHTPGFLLRFGVRRSFRLDPPYWLTIFLEVLAIYFVLYLYPDLGTTLPTWPQLIAHLFYLQEILGHGSLIIIFWTLCYEVQFYLFAVGALVVRRQIVEMAGKNVSNTIFNTAAVMVFIYSVAVFFGPLDTPVRGLFIDRWYQFFLGALALQCYLAGSVRLSFVLACLLVLGASLVNLDGADNGLAAVAVACVLVIAAQRNKMGTWLAGRGMQFLGRISYSLYLIHLVVGWRFIKLIGELHGEPLGPIASWVTLVAGVVVSVGSAALMYRLVERRALVAARQISLTKGLNWSDVRRSLGMLWTRRLVER